MKKGFTLIELLAVIVILAIIALIVTPVISNIINNSKKAAAIQSAYGYKDAVNNAYALSLITNQQNKMDCIYSIFGEAIYCPMTYGEMESSYDIEVTGSKPTGGYMKYEDNKLVDACLSINGYEVQYHDDIFSVNRKGNCGANTTYYTYFGEPVYDADDIPSNWEFYIGETDGFYYVPYTSYTEDRGDLELDECLNYLEEGAENKDGDSAICRHGVIKYVKTVVKDYLKEFFRTMDECVEFKEEFEGETDQYSTITNGVCEARNDAYSIKVTFNNDPDPDSTPFFGTEAACQNLANKIKNDSSDVTEVSCTLYPGTIYVYKYDGVFKNVEDINDIDRCINHINEKKEYGLMSDGSCEYTQEETPYYSLYYLGDRYYESFEECIKTNDMCYRDPNPESYHQRMLFYRTGDKTYSFSSIGNEDTVFKNNKQKLQGLCGEIGKNDDNKFVCRLNNNLVGDLYRDEAEIRQYFDSNTPYGTCSTYSGCDVIDPSDHSCHGPQC